MQTNQYNGLNHRIIRDEPGGSGVLTHFYYNQQWQVLEERAGSSPTAAKQYVNHPNYVDAIAVRFWDKDGSSGNGLEEEHYYLQDANFNVTAVTDNTGAVKERYAYTPYGEVTILDENFLKRPTQESDISNELLYTGRRLDPETGLQLNRNRFYAAGLGRWVNRDPIEYDSGTNNLYEYVDGNPAVGLDAWGLVGLTCDQQNTKNAKDGLRCKDKCNRGWKRDFYGCTQSRGVPDNCKKRAVEDWNSCGRKCERDNPMLKCRCVFDPTPCLGLATKMTAWGIMCASFPNGGETCNAQNPWTEAYENCLMTKGIKQRPY